MCTILNIRRKDVLSRALPIVWLRFALGLLLTSISLFSAQQLRAQSDDSQNSQDVAEAARQERARKQQQSSKHIYTNEDLHRGKILTPEDQLRALAKRKQRAPSTSEPETEPLDANSSTPQEPLGDVARRYRNAKKISPFHLPSQHPELAAPKIFAPIPELKPNVLLQPQPPRTFSPAKPISPFSRATAPIAPSLPSSRGHRVDPFARPRIQPAPPSAAVRPAEPRIAVQPNFTAPNSAPLFSPRSNSSSGQSIVVRQGDTLWTLSRQHLSRGTRWLELMAANPALGDPTHLVPGTLLTLPSRNTTRHAKSRTITVHAGESLSRIALNTYGHATAWPCIAYANPTLPNPHHLSIGQTLTLPASCTP